VLLAKNALKKQAVDLQKNATKVLVNAQIVFVTKEIKVLNLEDDLLQNMVNKKTISKQYQKNIKTLLYIL
jgi:hypothetical protein